MTDSTHLSSQPDPRYPIGRFTIPDTVTSELQAPWRQDIEALPSRMRDAVAGMSATQLDTPYRPEGWTVRQVVHHTADSHMNAYIRFRLALTEDEPIIKPYLEGLWANLPDAKDAPVETSLGLLDHLHERWGLLLRSMTEGQFARTFRHPERGLMTLEKNLALYAWHGQHHVAHIGLVAKATA